MGTLREVDATARAEGLEVTARRCEQMTSWVAAELADDGIAVNAISPGDVTPGGGPAPPGTDLACGASGATIPRRPRRSAIDLSIPSKTSVAACSAGNSSDSAVSCGKPASCRR